MKKVFLVILYFSLLIISYNAGIWIGRKVAKLKTTACYMNGLSDGLLLYEEISKERIQNLSFFSKDDRDVQILYQDGTIYINGKNSSYYKIYGGDCVG